MAVLAVCAALHGCARLRLGELDPPPGELIVVAVDIENNDAISDSDVLEGLVAHTDNLSLGDKPLLDREALVDDAARIERHYATLGYFDARVNDTHIAPCGPGAVAVTFVVDEGSPTRVATVAVVGLDAPPPGAEPEEVARLSTVRDRQASRIHLEVGHVWTEEVYHADKVRLRELLLARGFASALVFGEVVVDRASHAAHVTYQLAPGPLTRVSEIRVSGLRSVARQRVMRRVSIAPGDVVTPRSLAVVEADVFDLGIFVFARVEPVLADADAPETFDEALQRVLPTRVPVEISLQEQARVELRGGVGVGIDNARSELHGLVGYEHRNPFGELRQIDLMATPAWVFLPGFLEPDVNGLGAVVTANYHEPSVFEERVQLSAQGNYELTVEYGYRSHNIGGTPRLSRRLLPFLTAYIGYHAEYHAFFDVAPTFRAPPPVTLGFAFRERYLTSALEQGLTIDLRDNPVDPFQGFFAQLDVGEATNAFGSDFSFVRLGIDARGFWSPMRWLTFATRARFGQVFPLGEETPLTVRQRGGGSTDMRGFGAGRMGPMICLSGTGSTTRATDEVGCPVGSTSRVYVGGDLALIGNFETRWRLPYGFAAVAFVDAGQVWDGTEEATLGGLEAAVGPGLRYMTPFGPIRLDVAFLLTTPDAPRVNVHINIGQAF